MKDVQEFNTANCWLKRGLSIVPTKFGACTCILTTGVCCPLLALGCQHAVHIVPSATTPELQLLHAQNVCPSNSR